MEQSERLPKSALSLYVRLYCKRKGDTNTKYYNNMIEATKSWLSLSEEEKQQFADKLQECRINFKHRFADYLKNVEPYLKKKPLKSVAISAKKGDNNSNTYSNPQHQIEGKIKCSESQNDNLYYAENLDKTESGLEKSSWIKTFIEEEPSHHEVMAEEEHTLVPVPEPIPPSIKFAKQLFDIVQEMQGNNSDKTWTTLTSREKQKYRNAVLSLKKDYIEKFKAYLESLNSKQLFEYYLVQK